MLLYEEVDTMIKIDIDMPVSCNCCPCTQWIVSDLFCTCGVRKELEVTDNVYKGTKHCMCPLIKVD